MISGIARRLLQTWNGNPLKNTQSPAFSPDQDALRSVQNGLDGNIVKEGAVPSYTHYNPFIRELFKLRGDVVISMLPDNASNIVDVGCGTGSFDLYLHDNGYDVLGIDHYPELAKVYLRSAAHDNDRPAIVAGTTGQLPVRTATMDGVIAMDVLEHVSDLGLALEECRRILTNEGTLIVSGPSENRFYQLGRVIAGFSNDYHCRSIYDIDEQLRDQGWSRTSSHSLGFGSTLFEIYGYEVV